MILSVIIPTYNRSLTLKETLKNLCCKLNCEYNAELIIIDNGSTDDTRKEVDQIIEDYPKHNIKYYFENKPGLLAGRHLGFEKASGDLVTYLDDDVLISDDWIKAIITNMYIHHDIDFLTGPCLPKYEVEPPLWLNDFWENHESGKYCTWLSLLDFGPNPVHVDPNFVWGLNFTVRASVLKGLGGFHPDSIHNKYRKYQGDGETGLTVKAKVKGLKALYHPDVFLYHQVTKERMTIDYFGKRAYFQGVCDSFSSLREKYLNLPELERVREIKRQQSWIPGYRWKKLGAYWEDIKIKINLTKGLKTNKSSVGNDVVTYEEVLAHTQEQYKNGYAFHQEAFYIEKKVRDWVLKEDYWDYKIPGF